LLHSRGGNGSRNHPDILRNFIKTLYKIYTNFITAISEGIALFGYELAKIALWEAKSAIAS
jgi:hypothetical protein